MLGRIIRTITMCILLAAIHVISEGKPDVPLPVHGIINRSIDLLLPVDQTETELEIFWTYQTFILAIFTNNQLNIRNIKNVNRLETPDNGRKLRINNLRKEDGGIYSATIYTTDKKEYKTSYNLTVHDPVTPPVIRTLWKEMTTDRCNVSLYCSVPLNTSDLSYTWKYRHRGSEYQLYDNGSTIQISLKNDSWDMEILCIVQNPADQKNISYNVQKICHHYDMSRKSNNGTRHHQIPVVILVITVLLIIIIVIGVFLIIYKRKKKTKQKAEEPEEINYAVLLIESQSRDDKRVETKEDEQSEQTLYTTLVHQAT